MTKIKLMVLGIIVIASLGVFVSSCVKSLTITCYCTTTTTSGNFQSDLQAAIKEAGLFSDCSKVASILTDKGYRNVSCTEQ